MGLEEKGKVGSGPGLELWGVNVPGGEDLRALAACAGGIVKGSLSLVTSSAPRLRIVVGWIGIVGRVHVVELGVA